MAPSEDQTRQALSQWNLSDAALTPIIAGHINLTFLVVAETDRYILQWVNPIFGPEIHQDIKTITTLLQKAGISTPLLIPSKDGLLCVAEAAGGHWRLQTYIEGSTLMRADSAQRCGEAARHLARFHRALWSCDYQFKNKRVGVHDTARHLADLRSALDKHRDHRHYADIAPLAQRILSQSQALDLNLELPQRVVHGDPKISNILFSPLGKAICLVDLDTLARTPIALEMGDAFRSWCCCSAEDEPGEFDLSYFKAGIRAYTETLGELPSRQEIAAIPNMVEQISLELAARFCADALNENYFGWDKKRFSSASQHNLARANSQVCLGQSIRQQKKGMNQAVISSL